MIESSGQASNNIRAWIAGVPKALNLGTLVPGTPVTIGPAAIAI